MTSATRCTRCGRNGSRVKPITLQSLLTPDTVKRISETPYRFCDNADCDIVYFGENGDTFSKGDLTVRVGVKETDAPRPVCYCFNHTIEEINEQVQRTGKSTVLDDIKERMETACWCETKSPRGGCCLGTVGKYVKIAVAEHAGEVTPDTDDENQPDCCSPTTASAPAKDKTQRSGLFAAMGSLAAAVAASACCWLPLLLIGFGLSVGGVATWFERYRPVFLAVAGVLLALGFYLVYRPAPTCEPGSACGTPRPKLRRFNQAAIWIAALFVAAFALFPYYSPAIVRAWAHSSADPPAQDTSQVPTDLISQSYAIDGMTCESCSVTLELVLAKLPGVVEVSVSYEQSSATLRSRRGAVDLETVRNAIERAGFRLTNDNEQETR